MREINGKLYAHFETGTEGLVWTLVEDGQTGYDALNIIEDGDYLTIYENDGGIIFNDFIKKDTETGKESRPFNPWYKQQVALNMWIHWTQDGWEPDDWAKLFLNKVRAKLIKKEGV